MRLPNWPRWVWRCYAATFAAVATFVVCSFLPMWVVWFRVDCECMVQTVSRDDSLWGMLGGKPPGESWDQEYPHVDVVAWEWKKPAVITAVSVHLTAIVGVILGGVRWRKGGEVF